MRNKRFATKKLAIGLTLMVVAAGVTLATAGWGGWGYYYPSYDYSNNNLATGRISTAARTWTTWLWRTLQGWSADTTGLHSTCTLTSTATSTSTPT